MNYWDELDDKLKPWVDKDLNTKVLDLFAGCGGLSLGFEALGFETVGFEKNENVTKT